MRETDNGRERYLIVDHYRSTPTPTCSHRSQDPTLAPPLPSRLADVRQPDGT